MAGRSAIDDDVALNSSPSHLDDDQIDASNEPPIKKQKNKDEKVGERGGYLNWDEYFMAIAYLESLRSEDPKTQVGSCIVNGEKKIVGVGYNAMPTGCGSLPWKSRKQAIRSLDSKHLYVCHAEMNAIINKISSDVRDCVLYTTLFPCNECAKLIIQSGIREVVYSTMKSPEKPANQASKEMLDLAKITIRQFIPERNFFTIDFRKI